MSPGQIDGALVQWGERLFYPGIRIVKTAPQPRLVGNLARRAAAIRARIQATVFVARRKSWLRSPVAGAA
jgi:hypothetical protein